MFQITNNTKKN